jgi:uncharacterized HAD superfamily protein
VKKLRIGFDIDDVLVNSAVALTTLHNQVHGTTLNMSHIYNLEDTESWGVADGQGIIDRIQEIMAHEQWLDLDTPFEGAVAILLRLKDEGCKVFAVTGRPASTRGATLELLDRYYPGIFTDETLFMTDIFAVDGRPIEKVTKLDIARQLKLTHFVEDYLVHADVLADGGITTVLFSGAHYHWNKVGGHHSLVRLNNWQEIGEFFDDERRI